MCSCCCHDPQAQTQMSQKQTFSIFPFEVSISLGEGKEEKQNLMTCRVMPGDSPWFWGHAWTPGPQAVSG